MKLLTLAALLCAMLALTKAAAFAEMEFQPGKEEAIQGVLPEAKAEPEPETEETNQEGFAEPELETEETNQKGNNDVAKASTCRCPRGWTYYNHRCFVYVSTQMNWNNAAKYCQTLGGNLASVHNVYEYKALQHVVARANCYKPTTWIGGYKSGCYWYWLDGTRFSYTNWCCGEPTSTAQYCIQMNYTAKKCWDNLECSALRPSICARRAW